MAKCVSCNSCTRLVRVNDVDPRISLVWYCDVCQTASNAHTREIIDRETELYVEVKNRYNNMYLGNNKITL